MILVTPRCDLDHIRERAGSRYLLDNMQEPELSNRIIEKLLSNSATALELAQHVGVAEGSVLSSLDKLRAAGHVQCMAGEWSIGERFHAK